MKNIKTLDKEKTFENFVVREDNEIAFKKASEFLTSKQGLYIYGSTGVGKTHLALASYNNLPLGCRKFISTSELLLRIRSTFNKYSEETEKDIVDELTGFYKDWTTEGEVIKPNIEFLYLDDFGVEKISDFSLETLYIILDRRIRYNQKKVFITSNFSIHQIARIMSDRIASRICELCHIIKIEGEDWRLKKENGNNEDNRGNF